MWAAVELLYRDGVKAKPSWPPLVGEVRSEFVKGIHVLRLIPVGGNNGTAEKLASLWRPQLGLVSPSRVRFSGLEAEGEGSDRRWLAQSWSCEILSHDQAVRYFEPHMRVGDLSRRD